MKSALTIEALKAAAAAFADAESGQGEPALYGVTDGKAVGTHLERKFRLYLADRFVFREGNAARGIDLPELQVDMKTTSVTQPQSSCPYKSARQKIWGLGYALLVFVYEKSDDHDTRTGRLDIRHVVYVAAERTADYQMTRGIHEILDNDGNDDDLVAFMRDRMLPVEDIEAAKLAEELLRKRPPLGYLTISNALQWRLQYKRVLARAGEVAGVDRLR